MSSQEGFEWQRRSNGDLVVLHGRLATMLRGRRAREFVDEIASGGDQELTARLTGN
jgi:hypothetical protein